MQNSIVIVSLSWNLVPTISDKNDTPYFHKNVLNNILKDTQNSLFLSAQFCAKLENYMPGSAGHE